MTVTDRRPGQDVGGSPPATPPTPPTSSPSARDRFRPSREAEARVLLLIDMFSRKANGIRYLSYYAVLGSLIGRGQVDVAPLSGSAGFGYRTSEFGARLAAGMQTDESFSRLAERLRLIRRYLDKSWTTLKQYLYEIPGIADAAWHEDLT